MGIPLEFSTSHHETPGDDQWPSASIGPWSYYGSIICACDQVLAEEGPMPFLRPDLREKLGDGYQLQIYINQGFLRP
jgi:hypothetical protein